MDRRAFLLLTLAGAADAAPMPAPRPPSVEDGAAAAPAPPSDESSLAAFDAWRSQFMVRAMAQGLPPNVVIDAFAGLTPDPHILALETRQPEYSKPISDYVRGVVSDSRVAEGRRRLETLAWLPDIEAQFGVAPEILISVWAVESRFGAVQGDYDVLRALATLAGAGQRQAWAETQLIAVLQILAEGRISRAQLRGSWTGALGQTQFEPTQYLALAVDEDGDGRRDVWNSAPDALASAANLLAKAGWVSGGRWQREMILPAGFDYGLCEGPAQPLAVWTALGLRTADDLAWSATDRDAGAVLFCPAGAMGPALLALPNHFVLRRYNNSLAYALAVGLLADQIAGRPGLVTPWPPETPLSVADRIAAQAALARLGFDPGGVDGMIGANTRSALRAWQKLRGLPADGYLSPPVIGRLAAEAGGGAPPSGAPYPGSSNHR